MQSGSGHKLLVAIVNKGLGSKIVAAAKLAGARGGTIIPGRGTAPQSIYQSILGIPYEPEKELVLVGAELPLAEAVLAAMTETGNLNMPGHGVAFVLNLAKLRGVAQLEAMV